MPRLEDLVATAQAAASAAAASSDTASTAAQFAADSIAGAVAQGVEQATADLDSRVAEKVNLSTSQTRGAVDLAVEARVDTLTHGELQQLGDDDHPQYHNDVRGDVRYWTKVLADERFAPLLHGHAQADIAGLTAALAGKASSVHTHQFADLPASAPRGRRDYYRIPAAIGPFGDTYVFPPDPAGAAHDAGRRIKVTVFISGWATAGTGMVLTPYRVPMTAGVSGAVQQISSDGAYIVFPTQYSDGFTWWFEDVIPSAGNWKYGFRAQGHLANQANIGIGSKILVEDIGV